MYQGYQDVNQAFSQMGVQPSYARPLIEENHFIFHMLPYKFFIWAGPIAHFGRPLFKSLLKACLDASQGKGEEKQNSLFPKGPVILMTSQLKNKKCKEIVCLMPACSQVYTCTTFSRSTTSNTSKPIKLIMISADHIFNPLLSVWLSDEAQFIVFHILLMQMCIVHHQIAYMYFTLSSMHVCSWQLSTFSQDSLVTEIWKKIDQILLSWVHNASYCNTFKLYTEIFQSLM